MKIVKITPKFKAYRHGFKYGIRFDNYGSSGALIELHKMYGRESWHNVWYLTITRRRDTKTGNYLSWIYLRNESDITLLYLSGALDDS